MVCIVGKERGRTQPAQPAVACGSGERDFNRRFASLAAFARQSSSSPPRSSSPRAISGDCGNTREPHGTPPLPSTVQSTGRACIDFLLVTSALIRLASIENITPNQPNRSAHRLTTASKTRREIALSRRAFLPRTAEHRVIGYLVFDTELAEPTIGEVDDWMSAQIRKSKERIANTWPTNSIRIVSTGSIEGRPVCE